MAQSALFEGGSSVELAWAVEAAMCYGVRVGRPSVNLQDNVLMWRRVQDAASTLASNTAKEDTKRPKVGK